MVKFTRRFSDRQPVDFTADFFSLGNSYLAMAAEVTAQADCLRKRINLKGQMTFEINDRFADPVDIFDWWNNDIEIPGGTPFPIRARWSDSLSESGSSDDHGHKPLARSGASDACFYICRAATDYIWRGGSGFIFQNASTAYAA